MLLKVRSESEHTQGKLGLPSPEFWNLNSLHKNISISNKVRYYLLYYIGAMVMNEFDFPSLWWSTWPVLTVGNWISSLVIFLFKKRPNFLLYILAGIIEISHVQMHHQIHIYLREIYMEYYYQQELRGDLQKQY